MSEYGIEFPFTDEENLPLDFRRRQTATTVKQVLVPTLSGNLISVDTGIQVMLVNETYSIRASFEGETAIGSVHIDGTPQVWKYSNHEIT